MNLDCVDVYYVHNPESQLAAVSQIEFGNRLRAAFAFLEEVVSQGKIRDYGVATWNGYSCGSKKRAIITRWKKMVECARDIAGDDHHFRFIQLPLNLAMPEALISENQKVEGNDMPALEAAYALGLNSIASGSILQGQVARAVCPKQSVMRWARLPRTRKPVFNLCALHRKSRQR
jgi:aryl-alcohol dehydrogenase-like predicted oxidoreductase